jgi:hypothetical protein
VVRGGCCVAQRGRGPTVGDGFGERGEPRKFGVSEGIGGWKVEEVHIEIFLEEAAEGEGGREVARSGAEREKAVGVDLFH